ncbi:GntR family transcriptional regulator [Rhizobium sp. CG5]|uniref:GntR family transcriptional regulator n=1 Tax=Rhizobium sp. CG5 TaxID=2726076 RepID=UPI0020341306|nr:GntR family transcriptional regulator [Rhizobium sp. CG5]MCM2474240.1 GntR family transcriptional regulator [Rhizobium sp. CG5]
MRLSDVAYHGLRNAIIKAELLPGLPIDEKNCMDMLGVGRTPLREALQRLAQEDLVLAVPQRGYFVSSTSASDFFQLQEFRLQAEVMAARMAAVRISSGQLDAFASLIEEARIGVEAERMDIEWHLGIDEQMHRLIAEASGNTYLAQALTRLYALSVRSLYVSRLPVALLFEDLKDMVEIHAALESRDPNIAEAAMRGHLRVSATNLIRSVEAPTRQVRAEVKK